MKGAGSGQARPLMLRRFFPIRLGGLPSHLLDAEPSWWVSSKADTTVKTVEASEKNGSKTNRVETTGCYARAA